MTSYFGHLYIKIIMNKKIISFIVIALLVFSQSLSAKGKPKNVIFIIGDGMGLAQIHAGMVVN